MIQKERKVMMKSQKDQKNKNTSKDTNMATNALAHGMDIKTLSTILGHVSAATTLNTYSHITDEMRQ